MDPTNPWRKRQVEKTMQATNVDVEELLEKNHPTSKEIHNQQTKEASDYENLQSSREQIKSKGLCLPQNNSNSNNKTKLELVICPRVILCISPNGLQAGHCDATGIVSAVS